MEKPYTPNRVRTLSESSNSNEFTPTESDQISCGENGRTSFNVLTINLALVSPGWATLRYYLPIAVFATSCACAVYVSLVYADYVHPSFWSAFLLYGLCGASHAIGFRLWLVLVMGFGLTAFIVVLHYSDFSAPFFILSGYGFCEATSFIWSLVIGRGMSLICPRVFDSYVSERVELFLHHLKECGPYDVVCIQEATVILGRTDFRDKLEMGAAQLGLRHAVWSGTWPRLPALSASSGLGILSRHPIVSSSVRVNYFREQYMIEWPYVQRGMLFASIQPAGTRRVDICTLHNTASLENTSTGCGWAESCSDECIGGNNLGTRQAIECLEWFRRLSPPVTAIPMETPAMGKTSDDSCNSSLPCLRIVAGDLNVEKESKSFRKLASLADQRVGLFDAVPDSEPTFGTVDDDGNPTEWRLTFKMDRRRPRVLDHILADCPAVSGSVVPMMNDDQYTHHMFQQASDHRGVEATFLI